MDCCCSDYRILLDLIFFNLNICYTHTHICTHTLIAWSTELFRLRLQKSTFSVLRTGILKYQDKLHIKHIFFWLWIKHQKNFKDSKPLPFYEDNGFTEVRVKTSATARFLQAIKQSEASLSSPLIEISPRTPISACRSTLSFTLALACAQLVSF